METLRDVATGLSAQIARTRARSSSSPTVREMPVFAVQCKAGTPYTVFDVSDHLRRDGWQVPAYTMPEGAEDVAVLRFVIREGFTADLAGLLMLEPAEVDRGARGRRPGRHRRLALQPHVT